MIQRCLKHLLRHERECSLGGNLAAMSQLEDRHLVWPGSIFVACEMRYFMRFHILLLHLEQLGCEAETFHEVQDSGA